MLPEYQVHIRWRFNKHWGISAVNGYSEEGKCEVAILSYRHYSSGEWGAFNDHGFSDNNFPVAFNFPLVLLPKLVTWLRWQMRESCDYYEIVNPEYGRDIIHDFIVSCHPNTFSTGNLE